MSLLPRLSQNNASAAIDQPTDSENHRRNYEIPPPVSVTPTQSFGMIFRR